MPSLTLNMRVPFDSWAAVAGWSDDIGHLSHEHEHWEPQVLDAVDHRPAVVAVRLFGHPLAVDPLAVVAVALPRAVEEHMLALGVAPDQRDEERLGSSVHPDRDRRRTGLVE